MPTTARKMPFFPMDTTFAPPVKGVMSVVLAPVPVAAEAEIVALPWIV